MRRLSEPCCRLAAARLALIRADSDIEWRSDRARLTAEVAAFRLCFAKRLAPSGDDNRRTKEMRRRPHTFLAIQNPTRLDRTVPTLLNRKPLDARARLLDVLPLYFLKIFRSTFAFFSMSR